MSIAQSLLDHEAVKISLDPPFTWTSGIQSPIYCDNRIMPSFPEARDEIVEGFVELIEKEGLKPDAIGGTATAGISWAAFVAQRMGLPMFYVRPKPKSHGAGKQIEGVVEQGAKVLIVEDLISTGGSSIKSAEACQREADAKIMGVYSIVTYEMQKAEENFREAGLPTRSLVTFSDILNLLKSEDKITEDQYQTILEFRQDPPSWGDKL